MLSMNGGEYTLKYLFEVEYKDGTLYQQQPDDKSVQLPDEKNAYYDIHYAPIRAEEDMVRFSLIGDGHKVSVFMDGHFEVDGFVTTAPEAGLENVRHIFYKTHTHHMTLGGTDVGHDIAFVIGFQALKDGQNIEQTLSLS